MSYQELQKEIANGTPIDGLSEDQRKEVKKSLVEAWNKAISDIVYFDDDPDPVYSGVIDIDFVDEHEIGFSVEESRGDNVYFQMELFEQPEGGLFPLIGQISLGRGQWLFKLEAGGDYEVASDDNGNPLDEGIVWAVSNIVLPKVLAPVLSEVKL